MKPLLLIAIIFCILLQTSPGYAQSNDTLYRIQTYRAAPGHLEEFIAINQQLITQGFYDKWAVQAPFIARHSQGDQWDIMLILPMLNYQSFFTPERTQYRQQAHQKFAKQLERLEAVTAFKEDLFSQGPTLEKLNSQFKVNSFLHIEIFHAVAGKKQDLIKQRHIENQYLIGVGRTANEVFVVDAGGDADVMTIGFYPDLQSYAKPQTMNESQRDVIAKQVGFKGLNDISFYLRSLISSHHDTLANVVRSPDA